MYFKQRLYPQVHVQSVDTTDYDLLELSAGRQCSHYCHVFHKKEHAVQTEEKRPSWTTYRAFLYFRDEWKQQLYYCTVHKGAV